MKKILDLIKKLIFGNKAQKAIAAVQVAKEVKEKSAPAQKQEAKAKPAKKYYNSKPKAMRNSL